VIRERLYEEKKERDLGGDRNDGIGLMLGLKFEVEGRRASECG
jgi:hypothetical protein